MFFKKKLDKRFEMMLEIQHLDYRIKMNEALLRQCEHLIYNNNGLYSEEEFARHRSQKIKLSREEYIEFFHKANAIEEVLKEFKEL